MTNKTHVFVCCPPLIHAERYHQSVGFNNSLRLGIRKKTYKDALSNYRMLNCRQGITPPRQLRRPFVRLAEAAAQPIALISGYLIQLDSPLRSTQLNLTLFIFISLFSLVLVVNLVISNSTITCVFTFYSAPVRGSEVDTVPVGSTT